MISVRIIADSYNEDFDARITTFELEYPRFIHSELMTHRQFSRNAASSRAIPIDKVIELLKSNPAMPNHWGKNQAGMQANGEIEDTGTAEYLWKLAASKAIEVAEEMKALGLHKQVVNRILEPYQTMKTVVTSTCFNNFFWLRNHKDADPNIKELAAIMLEAFNKSEPVTLLKGEWHLPYVTSVRHSVYGRMFYCDSNGDVLELDEAKKVSASCCAQTSYRKSDESVDKAVMIYEKLITSDRCHASPTEHQATPIQYLSESYEQIQVDGVTHIDKLGIPWSGNFYGWIQHRQLIPDNAKSY
jgi:thymidylate synthase ThyX